MKPQQPHTRTANTRNTPAKSISSHHQDLTSGRQPISLRIQARALTALWESGLMIGLFVVAIVGSAVLAQYLLSTGDMPVEPQILSMLYAYLLPAAIIVLGLALKRVWDNALEPKRHVAPRKKRQPH